MRNCSGSRPSSASRFGDSVDALFHDEEIDGPLPGRPRVLALTLASERPMLTARAIDGIELLGAEDVGDVGDAGQPAESGVSGVETQLAVLALRLEMAAVYLRLAAG